MSDVQFSPFHLNPTTVEPQKPEVEVEIRPWSPPTHGAQITQGIAPQAPVTKEIDYANVPLPSFVENQQRAQAIIREQVPDPIMKLADFVCAVAFKEDSQLALRMEIFDILTIEILRARKLALGMDEMMKSLEERDNDEVPTDDEKTEEGQGEEGSGENT